ncbi:MAG: DUF4837 family protein [Bacteroidales bacterium]|nr:DUF4837 family protein [Bacteroidales bacterium]
MKRFVTLVLLSLTLLGVLSCNRNSRVLLPNVSGKAGEVIVVIDRENWEGNLGNAVRDILASDCPYLPQKEALFSVANVTPTGFADLFKVHRNIVIFNIDPQNQEEGVIYRNDVWAHPQCVIQVNAFDNEGALRLLTENADRVTASIEQAERDRIIANAKLYEEAKLAKVVTEMVGGSPHFPTGYKLKKKTDNFIWIADEKQYTNQGVFIYKYPASEAENFTRENIIAHRNKTLQENVPGMFDNTWMTTSDIVETSVEFIKFRGLQFAQTRGWWEVHNDFMGGPFVSHSFYGEGAKEIIVLEAWVYAPRYDKRQYLRQVESLLYSFEWAKPTE